MQYACCSAAMSPRHLGRSEVFGCALSNCCSVTSSASSINTATVMQPGLDAIAARQARQALLALLHIHGGQPFNRARRRAEEVPLLQGLSLQLARLCQSVQSKLLCDGRSLLAPSLRCSIDHKSVAEVVNVICG